MPTHLVFALLGTKDGGELFVSSSHSVWDASCDVWAIDCVAPRRHDFSLTRQRITFSRMGHLQINLSIILYHSGLSQARLARRTGLRPGTISDLVSGSARGCQASEPRIGFNLFRSVTDTASQ